MRDELFADRKEAGRLLGEALRGLAGQPVIVLGVPRGGVVVAAEVARALNAPLDVVMARKLGAPMQPELAIGAVVSGGGPPLLDWNTIRYLHIPEEYIQEETRRQRAEIDRRLRLYRGDRPEPDLTGKTVVVVDDGIATGYTIRAALTGLRQRNPGRLIVAVPVAPPGTCEELRGIADEVICLRTPEPFFAVGAWYEDFGQTTDEEVAALLRSQPGQESGRGASASRAA